MKLAALAEYLRQSLGVLQKQDIQTVARSLNPQEAKPYETREARGTFPFAPNSPLPTLLGDDCAAIPDQDGYLLLATEGMWPLLVETEPWFAGWCSILANISDIYAMGGRPIAVVDALWATSIQETEPIWAGMMAASKVYDVPIVGGHTNCHSPYRALSVAILGRATHLITSFNAQPGDVLLAAIDLRGKLHPKHPFWNASTDADPIQLRGDLSILPQLAAFGLCDAGKDISMGGIIGTLLMLLETSKCGAILNLDAIPCPENIDQERWLLCFPSYGFLLSVRPENVLAVQAAFHARNLVCEVIGHVHPQNQLTLKSEADEVVFWDLSQKSFTGFSPF